MPIGFTRLLFLFCFGIWFCLWAVCVYVCAWGFFLSPVAAGFFILRRQQTRKLKNYLFQGKNGVLRMFTHLLIHSLYFSDVFASFERKCGYYSKPVSDYPAVYSPVSFSHYKSLSVIHWLSKASWFPCQQHSDFIKWLNNNLLILMSLLEDNPVSILSCHELIMLERTGNWISAVAVQLICLIVKVAHRCVLSCRTFC